MRKTLARNGIAAYIRSEPRMQFAVEKLRMGVDNVELTLSGSPEQ
jgi:hypothetical protein